MKDENWQEVKRIFNSALDLRSDKREAYLAQACDGDPDLRQKVDAMLRSYRSEFMEPATSASGPNADRFSKGEQIGHYEIVQLLGVGGMGEVYLATDKSLDRKVAIKVLNEKYEAERSTLNRFIQEAKAASALNHPNILTVYEVGETDGSHYIVSEFIDGSTLREVLGEGPLQLREVLDLATQIAGALATAHAAYIIHRDIKPENIIIRDDGYARVLDFGLAKVVQHPVSLVGLEDATVERNRTAEGVILGTVSYMSPEQARGEAIDERTDIFSLGVLLYEMIAGRTPFSSDSTSETFANLINKDPQPLSRHAAGVPDELQRIVSKMLIKDRDDRYQTMKGVLSDIKELKDQITIESKFQRTSLPETEKDTAVFARTKGDAAQTTGESSVAAPWYRRWYVLAALPVILFGALGAGWYWRQTTATQQPQIKTLAVMPLRSLDAGENLIGFGIADAVIRRISQTGALTVRPTSAVKRYLTEETDALSAARELTVDAVLDGTVYRDGERVRISVNLLRTSDGSSLWSERFDTQSAEIFAVQDKVAQQVANRLRLQLDASQQARLAKRTTSNAEAYEYYVKGVYAFNQRRFDSLARKQIDESIDLLKKAVEKDPQYALAHAKLAHAYAWKGLFIDVDNQTSLLNNASEEISKADSLDPNLAETNLARFRLMFSEFGGWRIEEAAKAVLLAQQIDPNTGHEEIADIYLHIGLDDLMDREIRKALEIDPTSEWVKLQMKLFYHLLNRFDDYIQVRNEYFPEEPISPWYFVAKGNLAKAKEILDEAEKKDPQDVDLNLRAIILAMEGRRRESEAIVPQILKGTKRLYPAYHHFTYDIACIYALNNNVSETVRWLRETAAAGNPQFTQFATDPFLDKIRSSPEFIQFMAELKPKYEKYRSEFR